MAKKLPEPSASTTAAPAPADRSAGNTRKSNGAGILGGSSLAGFAQRLREPYKTALVIAAPMISVGIAAWGPSCLDLLDRGLRYAGRARRQWWTLRELRGYVKAEQRLLDDPTLDPSRRAALRDRIQKVQSSIDNHKYEWVAPYLRGDTSAGINNEPGTPRPASATPPGGSAA